MKDVLSIYNLVKGKTYKVIKEFVDYDRGIHAVGEVWTFDKTTYLPYHSGLTLFVVKDGANVVYRFQDVIEEHETLLLTFMKYVDEIEI